MKKKKYKVGDKIVDFGQVFRIFEIKTVPHKDGEERRMIYFKPYYKSEMSEIICSIPADNISKTLIRKPVTKDRLKQCITMLKKKELKEEYKDINAAKELLSTNKLTDIAKFIVYMWKEIDSADSVSKSKKDAYEKAKERFIQEWALVTKSPIDKTRDKLGATLKI